MEVKWYMIAMTVIIIGFIIGGAYSDHERAKCRIAAVQAHVSVTDVDKVCK